MRLSLSPRSLRVFAVAAAVAATAPTVLVATASRASAADPTFGAFALTSSVRATSTDGDLGETGGITPLDSGSASVDASLDANPSADVLARPVEPGTTYTTVTSQLPGLVSPAPAPPVPALPQAKADYPGTTTSATAQGASAAVTETTATGSATTAGNSSGGLTLGSTTASTSLATTGGGHAVTAVADSYVAGLDVLGVLSIRGVQGHAEIAATAGGTRTSTATTTVGSITVAGQAVAVDDSGVHVVGVTPLPLGPTLAQLDAAANGALAKAGITVSLLQPIHTTGTTALGNNAAADSGGLSVTVTSPDLGQQVSTVNTVTLTLGRVRLTETDQAATTADAVPTGDDGSGDIGTAAVDGTDAVPGTPGTVVTIGGDTTGPPPQVAAAPTARRLVVAGQQISPRAAIAALGGWQALTLGLATYAVIALRRRPEDEEEQLCPCPT